MAIVTMIIAHSGAGKSFSIKNMNPDGSLLIQPIRKSLPFRSTGWRKKFSAKDTSGSIYVGDDYMTVHKVIDAAVKSGKKRIIIDDANYFMQNASLRRAEEKGYEKFTQFAKDYISLFEHCRDLPDDVRVYFMTHGQVDESTGRLEPRTTGRMIDNQIYLPGLLTIILKGYEREGEFFFSTKTDGMDCVKTPFEMFEESEIPNDLSAVDSAICAYEGIEE